MNEEFDKAGVSRLKPFHLETVYRTNAAMAFSGGQLAQLDAAKEDFPFWRYSAVKDRRTRPSHRALDGKVFRTGDYKYYPPLTFNCRCEAIPISRSEAETENIEKSELPADLTKTLGKTDFIGNKNEKFLNWLERQTLSNEAKSRVKSATKRFSAELLSFDDALRYVESELKKDDFKNLYTEIETLVAKTRTVNESDDALIERLRKIIGKGRAIPLAAISDNLQKLYNTSVRIAYISDETLMKQIVKRQSQPIQFEDYFRIQNILDNAEIVVEQTELRYLFIKEGEGYYVVALKTTKNYQEMYIQSFYYTSREKSVESLLKSGKIVKDLRK